MFKFICKTLKKSKQNVSHGLQVWPFKRRAFTVLKPKTKVKKRNCHREKSLEG